MEDWKIQKNRARCEKAGCPLAAEKEFYAILQLPDCIRLERCRSCFEELKSDAATMPFHWMVRRNLDGSKHPMLDLESLRVLFDRLGESPDPVAQRGDTAVDDTAVESTAGGETAADEDPAESVRKAAGLRYLVALLLLRKRRLKMVDPKTPEQEAADLLVVDALLPEMEPIALHAPELDPDRLGNLREELMAAIGEETGSRSSVAE